MCNFEGIFISGTCMAVTYEIGIWLCFGTCILQHQIYYANAQWGNEGSMTYIYNPLAIFVLCYVTRA